jgi:hypothetical protein
MGFAADLSFKCGADGAAAQRAPPRVGGAAGALRGHGNSGGLKPPMERRRTDACAPIGETAGQHLRAPKGWRLRTAHSQMPIPYRH